MIEVAHQPYGVEAIIIALVLMCLTLTAAVWVVRHASVWMVQALAAVTVWGVLNGLLIKIVGWL